MNGYYNPNQQWQGFSGNPNYLNTNTSIPNTFRQQIKAAYQQAQNNYLVSALRPCPIPSYTVPNPYCCSSNVSTYNCCNGCGQ